MRRKTFDLILSMVGALVTVILLVAGSLLLWGYNFANQSVHSQLARQEIMFPPKAAFSHAKAGTEITPGMIPYLEKYAGQQLLTGPQAEAYADHFIAVHLSEMPYHGVYSQLSSAARAATPKSARAAELGALVQTSFMGTTLQGLLLEAYGFWMFGQIALWASISAYILGLVMLVLTVIGWIHLRRVPSDAMFPRDVEPRVMASV